MTNALVLEDVHANIQQYHILQGVTFDVPESEVTVLLGRNGAGKTTTLRTIMKMAQLTGGDIRLFDQSISPLATREVADLGVSYIPENLGIFGSLTVVENMRVASKTRHFDEERLNWIFGVFPEIKKFWEWPADRLSGGQKQMLAISRALIEPTKLLIMDEPSKGLAPFIVELFIEVIQELRELNTTMLIVEQNFKFSQAVGDHVVVLDGGKVVCTSSMEEFSGNHQLQIDLLGLNLSESK